MKTGRDRDNALLRSWRHTLRRCGETRAVMEAAGGAAVSFLELEARAEAWCVKHVGDRGQLAGRAVVFAQPNGVRWFEIFLGLLRTGAVLVPLDATEPPAEQRRLAEALRAGFWWDGTQLVPLARARRWRDPEVTLVKLTSGTTGAPRPLVFTAAQLLADARQVTRTMGIRAGDLNYGLIPLGHSYGLGNLTLPLLGQGVPLVCGALPLPQAIATDFAQWRPTVLPSVPAVFRALANSEMSSESLASLRLAISAGAPLAPEVARAFEARFSRRLHSFYGSSETGGIAFDRSGEATLAGSVGTPMRGVQIQALQGQRLRITSPAVFTHGNRCRHRGLGCWSPPDRAEIDSRGRITLLGRRGTTVKVAGRRVNLTEIVLRLRRIPGVRDAWVGLTSGAEPALAAVVATGRSVTELRLALHGELAPWKVPKRWSLVAELPLTARGKLDTRALRAGVEGS